MTVASNCSVAAATDEDCAVVSSVALDIVAALASNSVDADATRFVASATLLAIAIWSVMTLQLNMGAI